MEAISNNHFSLDLQAQDALNWLEDFHPEAHAKVLAELPEAGCLLFEGSWFDTDAMGVDIEFGSWLVDAIEQTGKVMWEEGEPYAIVAKSKDGRMRMIRKVSAFTKPE